MIRGVNKRIIEVVNPEDESFEKIIFFLSPQAKLEVSALSRKTEEYIETISGNIKKQSRETKRPKLFMQLSAAAALGATIMLVVGNWIG